MSSSPETAADSAIWLFKTRLCSRDLNLGLSELVLEECSEAMKEALAALVRERRSRRYVRVLTRDPNDPNGELYDLRLMNHAGEGHVLGNEWDLIVAANYLKIGDFVEGWGYRHDGGDEIYFTCELDIRRQNSEGFSSGSRERDSPSPGNQDPQHKRGEHGDKGKTPAKGDDVNPKKKENPAEGCSKRKYSPPSSQKSKSVGGNEKIDAGIIPSERKRLNSSLAIQESEQLHVEDIAADGENPEMEGFTNPREKKAVSPCEKERDYADIELVIKQCTGTLKVLDYFLRKLVKNNDEKNFDEEMKVAMDEVMKIIAEIKGRMEERV